MRTSEKTLKRIDRYFDFLLKNRANILLIALMLFGVSLYLAKKLTLRTNLAELLPQNLESVQLANKAKDRLGGTGLLLIGVQGPSYSDNRHFVEALTKSIDPLIGKTVRYYEYRYLDIQDYLHKYALHYFDNKQLVDLNSQLKNEIENHKGKAVKSFLGLDDDEPAAPQSDTAKGKGVSFDKMGESFKKFLNYRDGYLSADNGHIMVISIRPMSQSTGVEASRGLRDFMKSEVAKLDPKKFGKNIRVEYSGNVQQTLEEFDTIREDLFDTALHLIALITAVIFLFVWSVPVLVALAATLIVSVAYTFAITWLGIGYLNSQTAFMASIVVGTGINYGIIYLARFHELRKKLGTEESLRQGLKDTIAPTLIGSSSTAVAFLTLLVANNKGLSQFGFIGCVGVLFCWIVTYSLLPIVVFEYEKRGFRMYPWKNPFARQARRLGHYLGDWAVKHYKAGLGVMAVVTCVAVVGFLHLAKEPMEHDFDKVRTKLVYDSDYISFRKRTHSVFPTSLNPSLVFVDTEAEAREICPTVKEIKSHLPDSKNMIESCSSLYDVIPAKVEMTPERLALMKEAQTLMKNRLLKYADYGDVMMAIGDNAVVEPPTEKDIPLQIRQRFRELDGREGLFATVSPRGDRPLHDARNLINLTDSLTDFKLPQTGKVVSAASESFIFADILRGIDRDATLISMLAFISVIIHCVIFAGGIKNGLFMGLCLIIASFWMVGFQGWEDVKFNFFNFIALPLTFGIGIDYPVNVFMPIIQSQRPHYPRIFATSGAAVMLCSLTTFVGYYTLLNAKSQALSTFAHIAIIGEVACTMAALFFVPILLQLFSRGRALTSAAKLAQEESAQKTDGAAL